MFALCVATATLLPAFAAKADKVPNPDKPDKRTDRMDKIERKLERAGMDPAEASQVIAARQQMMMAATPPPPEPDRSYRDRSSSGGSDRGDRTSSGGRRSDRERNTYREPTTKADAKYDAFRIIVERNIFNPTRIGRTRSDADEKPARVDTIAFVGTMQDDRRTLAFFDSPDASFRKTLREGESVGEFKVEKIKPDEVELSRGDKPITLKLAQQLRRPEGGDWSVAAVERTDAAGAGSAAPAAAAQPPPIPADASPLLRRLMEERQKQLKQ